ncbi:hypothetical protein, partial [Streptomyces sp. DH12]|uniref:hypothetical protein n=1 Tax=Streptomyces sp. DH12 TaxID=2857010 RepID=UPI001E5253CF
MTKVVRGGPRTLLAVFLNDEAHKWLLYGGEFLHGPKVLMQDILCGAEGHEVTVEQQPSPSM